MIGMLRGKVWEIQSERLVIDVQGVGYLLTVPYGLLAKSCLGQELVVYTHVVMREDDLLPLWILLLRRKTTLFGNVKCFGHWP